MTFSKHSGWLQGSTKHLKLVKAETSDTVDKLVRYWVKKYLHLPLGLLARWCPC